jgi:hypothetical protein
MKRETKAGPLPGGCQKQFAHPQHPPPRARSALAQRLEIDHDKPIRAILA